MARKRKDDDGSRKAKSRGADSGAGEDADDPDADEGTGSGRTESWTVSYTSPSQWYQQRPNLHFDEPKPLEVRDRQDVRVGWKIAELVVWNGVHFGALRNTRSTYQADATAECVGGGVSWSTRWHVASPFSWSWDDAQLIAKHEPPGEGCSCGFYAVNDPTHLSENDGSWPLLEVELFGRVVVHEKGFRAERQRVRKVTLPASCVYCGDAAVGLGVFGFKPREDPGTLHPVCERHQFEHATFSLDDLTARMGTRFEWGT